MHKNQLFLRLVSFRTKVRFTLTFLLIVIHAFFVGGIAFYQDYFAQSISSTSTITVGIVATAGVIIGMILLELIYIFICDKWLDPMQQDVTDE